MFQRRRALRVWLGNRLFSRHIVSTGPATRLCSLHLYLFGSHLDPHLYLAHHCKLRFCHYGVAGTCQLRLCPRREGRNRNLREAESGGVCTSKLRFCFEWSAPTSCDFVPDSDDADEILALVRRGCPAFVDFAHKIRGIKDAVRSAGLRRWPAWMRR